MSVLHVDTGPGWRGGQQQVYLLHRELVSKGVPSRLLAPAGSPLSARCRSEGLPVRELPGRRAWDPRVLRSFLAALRGVELVHAHDSHAAALGALAKRLRPGLRLVCHRRVSYPLGRNPFSRWKYAGADAWVAVSGEIADLLAREGFGERSIRVVHSALDAEAFRAAAGAADREGLRGWLGFSPGAPVIGFCAAFTRQKGHQVLLDAAPAILAERPEAVFLLPGEGPLAAEVAASARDRGLSDSFRFPGFRADTAALTALFTIGVVPSVDGEGSSASLKEPLALGIPVAASDLAGNLEVLGDAGLSFRRGDPAALAGAVLRLLRDPALRADLGGRATVRSEAFSPVRAAEGVLALYREFGFAPPGGTA